MPLNAASKFLINPVKEAMTTEIWRVEIAFSNACTNSICCDESAAKTAYDEWFDFKSQSFDDVEKPIQICGFTDSADKAIRKIAFMPSEVNCVSVWKMY